VKNVVKSRGWLRNGCDGRPIAKNLVITIQVNLVSNPIGEGNMNSLELLLLKFAFSLPSQQFLGSHLRFYIFFSQ